jgi:hypothetical protein
MSNYRVRQVLALGAMPERQLRLLIALATFMTDDSLTVTAGFDAVIKVSGQARNTVRTARRELEAAGRIASQSSPGRGVLTVWTVLCLPEKGVNVLDPFSAPVKGVSQAPEKGSSEPEKRVTYPAPDLGRPEQGLKSRAKEPSSLYGQAREALARETGGVLERETFDLLVKSYEANPKAISAVALVKSAIKDGTLAYEIEHMYQPPVSPAELALKYAGDFMRDETPDADSAPRWCPGCGGHGGPYGDGSLGYDHHPADCRLAGVVPVWGRLADGRIGWEWPWPPEDNDRRTQ